MAHVKQSYPKWLFLLSNLLPILGIIFLGWDLTHLLFLYWAESAVIGLFHLVRIARSTAPSTLKAFFIPFFMVHFGGFMMVHGIFLFAITHLLESVAGIQSTFTNPLFESGEFFMNPLLVPLTIFSTLWPFLIAFLFSHGADALQAPPLQMKKQKDVMALMLAPYRRIIIMHLTILFGIFAFVLLNFIPFIREHAQAAIIPIMFIGFKTALEYKQAFKSKPTAQKPSTVS